MPSPLLSCILESIRAGGPITVADFVETALYHDPLGYYSGAALRSGRRGDFLTSVDVGPVFGELLAAQFAEMWQLLGEPDDFDLVEAAAGNARLARDVLSSAAERHPRCYRATRLHLVERSPRARQGQAEMLGTHVGKLASASDRIPDRVRGVIYANELLDALPPHLVVMRAEGLREVYVTENPSEPAAPLRTFEGPVSTPRIAEYLDRVGARLQPGWHAEVNLAAEDWVKDAGRSLECGFLVVIDYGHEASHLYSAVHASGTLTSYRRHVSEDGPGWLREPGQRDITSHVDLTGIAIAAREAGLDHLGTVDQTYFLLGLGLAEQLFDDGGAGPDEVRRRLALKTLLLPGGMGSTHKAIVFSRGVGAPTLRGLARRGRVT